MEYLSILFLMLAAICNAIIDTLDHHYHTSIFRYKCNPEFWNPTISWKNKYRNGAVSQGPAFFLSTGILVAFTDAWHLFKSMMIVLIVLSIVTFPYTFEICLFHSTFLNVLLWIGLLGTAWNVTFSFFYNKVLIKK